MDIEGLPGADLIGAGIRDMNAGRRSPQALLVEIGAGRLRDAGLNVPETQLIDSFPEHRLYALLAADDPDGAHGRYNALIRRLTSFERALEHARAR